MDILTLHNIGSKILKNFKIENPKKESEILISNLLGIENYKIYTEKIDVPWKIIEKYLKLIFERIKGIPVQYLTGKVYFFNCEFKIKKGIFIPRQETELLVEKAIKIYNENFYPKKVKILDIGTGCGNIAISLAKNIKNCYIIATDISKKSLEISEENAILNGVKDKIKFKFSNLFSKIDEKFDIIVSNPPYVSETDYKSLCKEVKNEPKRALIAGKDGLKFIKRIIERSGKFLKKKGFLIIEIGYNQFEMIKNFIPDNLNLISFDKDYSKYVRILTFKKE